MKVLNLIETIKVKSNASHIVHLLSMKEPGFAVAMMETFYPLLSYADSAEKTFKSAKFRQA